MITTSSTLEPSDADDWRVVDAHNDLLMELEFRSNEEDPFAARWLAQLEAGHVALQVCPTYTAELELLPELALRRCLQQIASFRRAVASSPDRVVAVVSRADLDVVERGERMGLLLAMEGLEPLGYDPVLMDVFFALGVRMASLTWNRRNPFADGAAEVGGGGLSRLGETVVDTMVRLGIVIDLAHASGTTFRDVLERSGEAPLCVSHAACRGVFDTPRNLDDEQLRALAERGGVLGVMQLPFAIDPSRSTIDRVVDHIDHAVAVMGIDHVGLGGDFVAQLSRAVPARSSPNPLAPPGMPNDAAIEGLAGPEGYPNLVARLRARGYAGRELDGLLGGNFLRLFRRALPSV